MSRQPDVASSHAIQPATERKYEKINHAIAELESEISRLEDFTTEIREGESNPPPAVAGGRFASISSVLSDLPETTETFTKRINAALCQLREMLT